MPRYIEKITSATYPFISLRALVAFPAITINMEVGDPTCISALAKAHESGENVLFLTQRDPSIDQVKYKKEMFRAGCVMKIKSFTQSGDRSAQVVVEGLCRASVVGLDFVSGRAEVLEKHISADVVLTPKSAAVLRQAKALFNAFVRQIPKYNDDFVASMRVITSPGFFADSIAYNILNEFEQKQQVLEALDPLRRLELACGFLESEMEQRLLDVEIHRRVRDRIEQNQREYYLKEQLKVVQEELHEDDEEIDEYAEKIDKLAAPEYVLTKLTKELAKLSRTPYSSSDAAVIRSYLDTMLEIPWSNTTKDSSNIANVKKILDRDHDGMTKVKERIVEYVAASKLTDKVKNQVLCLVGPPGVGKTSIAASLAESMGRKYVRVSLGGVRDEADIRGHRRTYVASMPGRIVSALISAEVKNPLILLDEIDKLGNDFRGDPTSALLEVLDGEQNSAFRDHYLEMPLDLSDCIFIATANNLSNVSRPLLDRMEVIELQSYARHEKFNIAKKYLVKKQATRHGLTAKTLKISDAALYEVIDHYTREAGVRNLEREIAALCRKSAVKVVAGESMVKVTASCVESMLGARKYLPDPPMASRVGVACGLAYTEVGGEVLPVEAAAMPGTGKIELTGSLGAVMKESASIAVSYIRKNHCTLGVDADFYKTTDIHVHFPEGAVPKDGPSAGVALVCAITSELSGMPLRSDVAMTGEVNLSGDVLAIGGLKEKVGAAVRHGITTVLIPEENRRHIAELDVELRDSVEFVYCRTVDDVLAVAMEQNQKSKSWETFEKVPHTPQNFEKRNRV